MFRWLVGATLVLTAETSLAGDVLLLDPLDGKASAAWRVPPREFVAAPDGRLAARYERGQTWSAEGQPWVGDATWEAYRVEVDVWPEKNWAGIDFHVQEDGRAAVELTLLRVAEGRLAFELSGIWGRASAWKLWPVGQILPQHPEGWIHLRVDVGAGTANVFVGETHEAVASFRDLPTPGRGGLRLAAYAGSALFRDLRVARLDAADVRPLLGDAWRDVRGAEVLREWRVSPRFEAAQAPVEPPPLDASWTAASADGRGVVHLTSRFPEANESGVVFAHTSIHAAQAGEVRLRLTYTDALTLWCNGRRVFDGPPRQWFHPDREKNGNSRLVPDQYEVPVSVRAGENALVVRSATSEPFGWGFWVRVAERR